MTDVSDLQDRWDFILIQHGERVANLQARTAALQERVDALENAPHKPGFGGFLSRIFNKVVKVWPLKFQIFRRHRERKDLNSLLTSSAENVFSNLSFRALKSVKDGVLQEDYLHIQKTGEQLDNAHSTIQSAINEAERAVQLETADLYTKDALTSAQSRAQTQKALRSIRSAIEDVAEIQRNVKFHSSSISEGTLGNLEFSNHLGFVSEIEFGNNAASAYGDLMNRTNIDDLRRTISSMQEMDSSVVRACRGIVAAQKQLLNYAVSLARKESPAVRELCNSLSSCIPQTISNSLNTRNPSM